MNHEEREKIISEEFADLLINYGGDYSKLDPFKLYSGQAVNIINQDFAVVHIPAEIITTESIMEFGISAIPSCFGLVSPLNKNQTASRLPRSSPNISAKGRSVLIGYVDTGVDYQNPIFKYADKSTKILSIWDQTIVSENQYPKDFFFGTEYSQLLINQALKSEDPLSIVPSTDENGHGTQLAEITQEAYLEARNLNEIIPEAEYVIVKLKPAKAYLKDLLSISNDVLCFQENDIMLGVKYLIAVAKQQNRPLAICISLGTGLGSHDDLSPLNTFLSSLGNQIGIGIAIAAGNEGNSGTHFYGNVDPKRQYDLIELHVGLDENDFAMQIWGDSPTIFTIDITAPSGDEIPRIPARFQNNRTYTFLFGETTLFIDYLIAELQTGDQLILARFKNPLPGIWKFRIYGKGDLPFSYNIWLPGENFISRNTYFTDPDPFTTITNPGNATVPITVTAFNEQTQKVDTNASRGYTRTNVVKPELAVPNLNEFMPTTTNGDFESLGTSASVAYTTGIIAILLEWGITRGNYATLNSFEIKKILVRGAIRNPKQTYPNKEMGYGLLNLYTTFENTRRELL